MNFLVEHYWPGVTLEAFESAAKRLRTSTFEMAAGGAMIRFLHSTLVLKDETVYCVLEADSPAMVEEAYVRAEVTYERMQEAIPMGSGSWPDADETPSRGK